MAGNQTNAGKPPWMTTLGRPAGVAATILGLGLVLLFWWDLETTGDAYATVLGFGLAFTVFGIVLAVFGNPAMKRRYAPVEREPDERLLREVAKHQFPFTICTVRHEVLAGGSDVPSNRAHRQCNPRLHHLEVGDEEDLKLALAALE